MAINNALMKAVGNELVEAGAKNAGKYMAKETAEGVAKSALKSLVPKATNVASNLSDDVVRLYRGQKNTLGKLDYNNGLSPNSNGFYFTPNKADTTNWSGKGVVYVDANKNDILTGKELAKLRKDADRFNTDVKFQMDLYNSDPKAYEIYEAMGAGDNYQSLSKALGKPFIQPDTGQGTELSELIFFPDTNPELTQKYNDILSSGKNQWANIAENKGITQYIPEATGNNASTLNSLVPKNNKMDALLKKARNYKDASRFETMNNPIKGSMIFGEEPTSPFQRDTRAVRINMFPNDAVKGTGMTKQYLLNLFKEANEQGIKEIIPSYGSYTKDGQSFMNHLAEQGWVKANKYPSGAIGYTIEPKISEWEKTTPLIDVYNKAHNITLEPAKKLGSDLNSVAKAMREYKAKNMSRMAGNFEEYSNENFDWYAIRKKAEDILSNSVGEKGLRDFKTYIEPVVNNSHRAGEYEINKIVATNFLNNKDSDKIVEVSRQLLPPGTKIYRRGSKDGISWTTNKALAESGRYDGELLEHTLTKNDRYIAPQFIDIFQRTIENEDQVIFKLK